LIVKEKLPSSLEFAAELPTLRGSPSTIFRFNITLKNQGDQDLAVNLVSDAPPGFQVSFKLSGQDVVDIPLAANESKRLSVEAQAFAQVPAAAYPITVLAQGGDVEATITLTAEVVGQPQLTVTTPDGRLSAQANVGNTSALKILVENTGSAPVRNVKLTASQPAAWSVEFDPNQIAEVAAGKLAEVTVSIKPADKALPS
jgi:uncharacterized membrane protein